MPRLRPPARTQEEIGQTPKDEPIDIELEAAPEPEAMVEVAEPEVAESSSPEPEKSPEPQPQEDDLRKRLAGLERSEAENRRLQQELADYQRQLQEAQKAHSATREERDDAYYAGILNAMDAAEAQANNANHAIDIALEANDREAAAVARRNLAKAEVAISRYEEQKAQYEESRKTRAEAKPEPQQRSQQDTFEAAIAQYPEEAKRRFRDHPEYVTSPRKTAQLVAAHWDAVEAGHGQYTPEYFKYLDDKVFSPQDLKVVESGRPYVDAQTGKHVDRDGRIVEQVQELKRSTAVPSAPPTRDVPSSATGKPQSTRVTLTAEERDIARSTRSKHQSPEEAELAYARSKMKYAEAKKSGQYQERG